MVATQTFWIFHPDPWWDVHPILTLIDIFQMGWFNHQLVYVICYICTSYYFKWEWSPFQDVNHCFILIGFCWFSTSSPTTWAWPSTLHLHQPTDRFNCFAKPTERLRIWKPISPKNAPCMKNIYIYLYPYSYLPSIFTPFILDIYCFSSCYPLLFFASLELTQASAFWFTWNE